MTDKARELLERALLYVDVLCPIYQEIRTYLADTNPSETINSQEVDRSWTNSSTIPSLNDTINANSRDSGHE